MNKETLQHFTEYLDKIGEKLGVGVDKIWPWFITQQYIDFILSCLVFLTIGIVFYLCFKFTLKHWNPEQKGIYSIDESDHEFIWSFANVLLFIVTAGCFIEFFLNFGKIFNPEYYAFKEVLSQLGM